MDLDINFDIWHVINDFDVEPMQIDWAQDMNPYIEYGQCVTDIPGCQVLLSSLYILIRGWIKYKLEFCWRTFIGAENKI